MFLQPSSAYFENHQNNDGATTESSCSSTNSPQEPPPPPTPQQQSVIVERHQADTPYYPPPPSCGPFAAQSSPYPVGGGGGGNCQQFPFFFGPDGFFPFPTPDNLASPSINSPLTNPGGFSPFPIYSQTARSPFPDFCALAPNHMVQYNNSAKKSQAGRKPRDQMMDLEDDDDDKRLKRRQRNKEAAARCRQRRVDLMSDLQQQVAHVKKINDSKEQEVKQLRKQLDEYKSYYENHVCKLSLDERRQQMPMIPPRPPPMPIHQPMHLHMDLAMPPRTASAALSMVSNQSSTSSEQASPVEDYKPTIDELKALPPISLKRPMLQPTFLPPPPTTSTATYSIPSTSATPSVPMSSAVPVPSNTNTITRNTNNTFLEPEPKIPKLENDRMLTTLASSVGDVERPSALPTLLSLTPTSSIISTPSRPFRFGHDQASINDPSFFDGGDFLSDKTGLTPSGQPNINFVTTPTPLQNSADADLRPL